MWPFILLRHHEGETPEKATMQCPEGRGCSLHVCKVLGLLPNADRLGPRCCFLPINDTHRRPGLSISSTSIISRRSVESSIDDTFIAVFTIQFQNRKRAHLGPIAECRPRRRWSINFSCDANCKYELRGHMKPSNSILLSIGNVLTLLTLVFYE